MTSSVDHSEKPSENPENKAPEGSLGAFVDHAIATLNESGLSYGHGTDNAVDEAVFIVLEGLGLAIDDLGSVWERPLSAPETQRLHGLIEARIKTRKPASYLLNKAYIQGLPFYVDERVIVPRSFIAEILCREEGFFGIHDYEGVTSVLDLCTGSGCLAILAAHLFPNAKVDAVDLSSEALEVAKKNVELHNMKDRITLYEGDLFAPLAGKNYDLIITNPPYVDQQGMDSLPEEFRHEPEMALAAGKDGLDIVRRIMDEAKAYLTPKGGMICELGRCGPDLEKAYPKTPFIWLDTENSSGEVFWLKFRDL